MTPDITAEFVWSRIPKRGRESNKGSFGAVLAVAGSACYRGAAALTVEGALRTGAGIVTLASVEPVMAAVAARLPECCLCPCEPGGRGGISPQSIPRILRQKATVLLIGPGLGYLAQSSARAAETRTLVKKLLTGFSGSAVLDADGLNAAASLMNGGEELPRPAKELILTPHPGEMSRLTGLSVEAVQADREGIARRYAAQWNAVVVLKGARTVVAGPDGRVCVNPTGNPGLARGGSGDVLAGMTSALLACGLPAYDAAACAVWLHGAAADRAAARRGEYGMLPQDIFPSWGGCLRRTTAETWRTTRRMHKILSHFPASDTKEVLNMVEKLEKIISQSQNIVFLAVQVCPPRAASRISVAWTASIIRNMTIRPRPS